MGSPKKQRMTTAQQFNGRNICKAFNDGRGGNRDERQCPAKGIHVCDVVLPSGKPCGSRSHHRAGHPQPRWGR